MRSIMLCALLCVIIPPGKVEAQAQHSRVAVDGDELFIADVGTGYPVVMLHDGTLHSVIWQHQIDSLSTRWRVVAYDRRGYGRSTKPDTSYSNVEDLKRVLDHLDITRAVLVGASAGGHVAMEFAVLYPERVAGLVLVGAVIGGFEMVPEFVSLRWRLVEPLLTPDHTSLRNPLPAEAIDETIRRYRDDPYIISERNASAKAWFIEQLKGSFANVLNPGRHIKWLEPPVSGRLAEIRAPTLIVVGEDDHPELHAQAGALQWGIPDATRVIVSSAGHLPQIERPDVTNALISTFLRERAAW
jgi:3-oxoadipate enol-lactonase